MRHVLTVALVLLAAPAFAQGTPPMEGPISCTSPVAATDSAKSLRQRYGDDAVLQDLPGVEGETYKGLVLFPRAMDRRIEVGFVEDKTATVSGLTLRDTAKTSRWSVAGVTIGASLAAVQKANGKPFVVSGFGWDYGGFVTDFKNGALGRMLPGGCSLTVRFGRDGNVPKALSGDGVKVASDNASLLKFAPVVTEISVNFAAK
ncbi:hypothetical protein SSBR45G_07420 [Bradyrhizobium sp. SSBR45G]|uniref:hypothetical protein n=1 Tax=unclassified Bradyrhizobium TaxID=2631580 RepID=UPI002342AB13|nr:MULTISPECIES: hypothetical protein [unclassified Bradyrhizobium]GLH75834.1 hypothetical protein SSBR45G_07420 [Bradyrhizobium sp. SSBR45G]GLH85071.1 hypothetical protein SSBR45R_25310 [Bradyrhizobium sp. SSBR45R]